MNDIWIRGTPAPGDPAAAAAAAAAEDGGGGMTTLRGDSSEMRLNSSKMWRPIRNFVVCVLLPEFTAEGLSSVKPVCTWPNPV